MVAYQRGEEHGQWLAGLEKTLIPSAWRTDCEQSQKMATEYLTLSFQGGHSECCDFIQNQQQKNFYRVKVISIPCCSAISHQLVIDELVKYFNKKHRAGYWMFTAP